MTERQEMRVVSGEECDFGVEDPALLISIAWSRRWQSRQVSVDCAQHAKTVLKGKTGERARVLRGRADATLAWQAKWRGDFDEALRLALKASENLPESDHPCERAELCSIEGVVHYSRHRLDLADSAVQRGLRIVPRDAAPDTLADLLTTCATIHLYVGNLRSAGEALGQARQAASREMLARVEHNIARWMLVDKAPSHGVEHARNAVTLCVAHQNNVVLPYAHEIAGACLVELGEIEEAKEHFTKGLDMATKDKDARAQCQIIGWFAGLEHKQNSLERARDLYRYGTEIAKRMEYTLWEKSFARHLADVYEALGDLVNSVECHKRAWKLEEEKRV